MGRSVSPADAGGRRRGGALARLALGLALVLAAGAACAQSAATQGAAARNPDKLVLEANELVYDKDHNTVSAVGGVELYYKHRVLQADRVVYNRVTKRLFAEGHANSISPTISPPASPKASNRWGSIAPASLRHGSNARPVR
jgi:LPS-assembly protein